MNGQIIEQFMAAWNAQDLELILSFFSEDAVYCNVPMGPAHQGKSEIRAFISHFVSSAEAINFITHNQIVGANGIVMNERSDCFIFNGQSVTLPVMGIFELKDGKITAWRDYFDMAPLQTVGF